MRVSVILLVLSALLSSSLAQPTTSDNSTGPSNATTAAPTTQAPTEAPTTIAPTTLPTLVPSNGTTEAPTTTAPTTLPTLVPSNATGAAPTNAPSNGTGGEPTGPPNSGIVPTPANIVCYQEVVATQGSYAQIDSSLKAWSQKLYQTLGLTGPIELSVGWARVPDRTGFENGCNGPYPNIADLFVHIQVNTSSYDSVKSGLESFIAANRMTSQPNIVCSARSIITYVPGCGKVTGGAPINNGTIAPPSNITSSTGSESNITSSSTGSESNITSSSTGSESNITSSTGSESNTTSSTESSIPSNVTESSTGLGSESSLFSSSSSSNVTDNGTSNGNTTLTPTLFPVGGASQNAGASGGISVGEAHTTTMTTGTLGVILLVSVVGTML